MSATAITEAPGEPVVKVCACCQRTYTFREWCVLKLKGHGAGLEFRDCPCTNTLTLPISEEA